MQKYWFWLKPATSSILAKEIWAIRRFVFLNDPEQNIVNKKHEGRIKASQDLNSISAEQKRKNSQAFVQPIASVFRVSPMRIFFTILGTGEDARKGEGILFAEYCYPQVQLSSRAASENKFSIPENTQDLLAGHAKPKQPHPGPFPKEKTHQFKISQHSFQIEILHNRHRSTKIFGKNRKNSSQKIRGMGMPRPEENY